jgi:hypothetical protein
VLFLLSNKLENTMKHTLTLLVLFVALIAQSCSNEKIENDWTRDNLQGKVLSYSEFSYEAENRFGNIEKGERYRPWSNEYDHQIKYDEKGNKIEKNSYNSDGSLSSRYTYKYDEKGNKIEKNSYNSDGSLSSKDTHKYDEKGNKIEDNTYNFGGSLRFKGTHKYDEKGNKIEDNYYNSDGSLRSRYTYKYDEKGNKIEGNEYYSDGSLRSRYTYKYDEKGNKIEENEYNSDGSLARKWTYKYDEKGNKIEENEYNSDGSLNSKNTYKYEYDKQCNWIRRIEFTNGIPEYILERQYEYYDYITPYENNTTAGDDDSDGSNVSSSKDYKDDDYDDDLPEMPEKNKTPIKSSNKIEESEEKSKKREGRYKNRSKFPLCNMVTAKCSWCNVEFEQIEAFKHPRGTYNSSDIYKLKNSSFELNYLESIYELIQNGDEDGANSELFGYDLVFGLSYYCSSKCANHQ